MRDRQRFGMTIFRYFEYHGNDCKSDWSQRTAHSKTQDMAGRHAADAGAWVHA